MIGYRLNAHSFAGKHYIASIPILDHTNERFDFANVEVREFTDTKRTIVQDADHLLRIAACLDRGSTRELAQRQVLDYLNSIHGNQLAA